MKKEGKIVTIGYIHHFEGMINDIEEKVFREWLLTFNTDSATSCFTAVQELKKKIDFK